MKRLLILLALVSLTYGQGWNTWNTWNSWLGRMRYLVPTDNLALFVNPGAQMIDNAQGNKRYPALQYRSNVYAEPTQTMASGKLYLFTFTSDATEGKVTLSNSSISDSVSIVSGYNSFYVRADASSGTWGWNTTATITNKSFKQISNVDAPSTTVVDYSDNGNNGTAQGGLETNQPVCPYAWEFDGVDDRIDFGTEVGKMETNPFLITGWFKTTATSGTILSRRQTTDSWYRININSSGKLAIELSYDYGNTTGNVHYEFFSSHIAVNDDIWHFFALVRDNNSDVWLWVDNIKQTATCNFPENLDGFSSNTHLFFGCYRTSIVDPFAGKIAPVTIYPFDGQDGRASVMPSNYVDHYIKKIYNNTERYFNIY